MDMIELAREIGKQIQQDSSYINVKDAEQACDEDKNLQQQIADFNMKRMTLSQESNKQPRDDQKVAKLNQELRECYEKVMSNENMSNYNNAKSAEGADPDTVQEQTDCGHDCSCCSGCH